MKSSSVSQGWQYSTVHNSACKVIEEQTLWGQTVCRVWLPNQDAVVRVPRSALRPLSADLQPEIEAGLVMRELKLRGLVRRTLVVSPKGIATQWVAEMQTHFNEQFQLVLGDDIGTLQRLAQGAEHQSSAWSMFDQVIVSLDSVKSMDKRRGWTAERVAEYNRSRFEDLITSGRHIWDTLQTAEAQVQDTLGQDESITAHERLQEAVEQAGQELFDALQQAHLASVNREEERGMVAFTSRRKAIERSWAAGGAPVPSGSL